jgi:hypothetical protein
MEAGATLGALQQALSELYDLPATPDVADFLRTDRACLAGFAGARASDEQLLVAEDDEGLAVTLYIAAPVLERLRERDPFAALTQENLGDYLTAVEGVSHFVYLAWNAGYDKPVSLLELELQAEVDKYVLGARLLQQQGAGRVPHELHRALFARTRIDPVAAAGRISLYREASNYAARFCRRVAARGASRARGATSEMLAELRRFYRWGSARKVAHIERYA